MKGNTAYLLAFDQGTTSSRIVIFDQNLVARKQFQKPLAYDCPHPGWVEQNPETIIHDCHELIQQALDYLQDEATLVAGLTISNQRETTLIWQRDTGKCIYPAIVWQDRRTHEFCENLQQTYGHEWLHKKTGLRFDPYFSASKIHWILSHSDSGFSRANNNELAFGTIDSFLIYQLTAKKYHITDATNASRTGLFNLNTNKWDQALCEAFQVPPQILPEIYPNIFTIPLADYPFPIIASCGDQQAASIGQQCFNEGDMKATFGTGCFAMLTCGSHPKFSQKHLLATLGFDLNQHKKYSLEGSIFMAGALCQWLKDNLGCFEDYQDMAQLAQQADSDDPTIFVPAFTGLGAPYWQAEAPALMVGMTRKTGKAEIVKAALEAVCLQTKDLIVAMEQDTGLNIKQFYVDGGMCNNPWFLQRLSDILQLEVYKPEHTEMTAYGTAFLGALSLQWVRNMAEIKQLHQKQYTRFTPGWPPSMAENLYKKWQDTIVKRCLS